MKWICAALAAGVLCACGVATTPAATLYDDGDQGGPDCPFRASYDGQPGVPGDPCVSAADDCSPACCSCGTGTDSYWASECFDGVCASDRIACADAFDADQSLCTE